MAGVLVGMFTGALHAPLREASSPKRTGEARGPAKRIDDAIRALNAAADALDRLPFSLEDDRPSLLLAALNRRAAASLAKARKNIVPSRPANVVRKRAVTELLHLYAHGFGRKPRPNRGPFFRFLTLIWETAAALPGMDRSVIGTVAAAWAGAERALKGRGKQGQKSRTAG